MPRTTASAALLAIALVCASLAGQPSADLPVAKDTALPQALIAAELRFSATGDKLLVVRQYGEGTTPLVTIHDAGPGRKHGRSTYFPLIYPDLYSINNVTPGFRPRGISATLSPDGNFLATSSFKFVRLWDLSKEGEKGWWPPKPVTLDFPGSAAVAFTKDGKQLLTASIIGGMKLREKAEFEVKLWDVGSGKPIGEPGTATAPDIAMRGAPRDTLQSLAFAPDGASFLTAAGASNSDAQSVQLWDAKTLKPLGEPLPAAGLVHRFGRDGKTLLAVSTREIALWDIANRKPICTLPTPEIEKEMRRGYDLSHMTKWKPWFAIHTDGTSVLSAKDDEVQWWDLSGEKPVAKQTLRHSGEIPGNVYWVAISHDGKRAATARENSDEVLIWSLETGKPVIKIPHKQRVMAMEFSPDAQMLATADAGDVHLWNLDVKK